MKRRKSKYDHRVHYCPKTNRIILILWDMAIDGVSQWYHSDGKTAWWTNGKLDTSMYIELSRDFEGAYYAN